MLYRSIPLAALLLGLALAPAVAQPRPDVASDAAAARTLEQNRKVLVGPPAVAPAPPAEVRATVPPGRRLALASDATRKR